MRWRGPGARFYLLAATVALAVLSVGIAGLLVHAGVSAELAQRDPALGAGLEACVLRACIEAALVSAGLAILVALPLAFQLARPLRRLDLLARRVAAGESPAAVRDVGGGREIAELATTLERLAAGLRRQDDIRRSTAADVSHELRGILGGITGGIEAIQDRVVEPDSGLRRLADDARRLGTVVGDLERLVEAQRPGLLVRTEDVDLAAVVADRVAAHALRFASASIAVESAIAPARVTGDADRLGQVIDNLLTNARRYTDPGGRVRVSLEQTPGETVLAVADTGIGIAPEHLAQVFDRFWRAPDARRRAAEGTGVGLALVRDLVRAHHGRVEVFSSPGCGSRFVVLLPTAPRPRAAGLGRRPRADRLTAGAADRPAARRAPA